MSLTERRLGELRALLMLGDDALAVEARPALRELVAEVTRLGAAVQNMREWNETLVRRGSDQVAESERKNEALNAEVEQLRRLRHDTRAALWSLMAEVGGLRRRLRDHTDEPEPFEVTP